VGIDRRTVTADRRELPVTSVAAGCRKPAPVGRAAVGWASDSG